MVKWRHMVTEIFVNIGSGNGVLSDDTKPLPEPMLTDNQWSQITFILGQFDKVTTFNHSNLLENYMSKIVLKFSRGQWVNRIPHPLGHLAVKDVLGSKDTVRP